VILRYIVVVYFCPFDGRLNFIGHKDNFRSLPQLLASVAAILQCQVKDSSPRLYGQCRRTSLITYLTRRVASGSDNNWRYELSAHPSNALLQMMTMYPHHL